MFHKQSTKQEKSRKTNGSKLIISMIAIAKENTGKKWNYTCKNVSVMYYCRNTTDTTNSWVIWHSSHYIHWTRWSSDALANETGLKKQPASLQPVIWQLLIIVNTLCISSAEEGDFFFYFSRKDHTRCSSQSVYNNWQNSKV